MKLTKACSYVSSRAIRKIIERIPSQQLPPEVALPRLRGLGGPQGPLLPTPKEGDAAAAPIPGDAIPASRQEQLPDPGAGFVTGTELAFLGSRAAG